MSGTTLKDRLILLAGDSAAYRAIRKALHLPADPDDLNLSLAHDNGPVLYTIASLRSALRNFVKSHDQDEEPPCSYCKQAKSAIDRATEALRGSGWEE